MPVAKTETSPERVMQKRRKTMNTKTEISEEKSAVAYIGHTIEERKGKEYWTRVGVAFKPHGDGKGFTTVFAKGIAVSGEVVWREPLPQDEEQPATTTDEEIPF
jgi:hypothetical protein